MLKCQQGSMNSFFLITTQRLNFMRQKVYSEKEHMFIEAKLAFKERRAVIVTFADGGREVVNAFRGRLRDEPPKIETLRGWTHEFASFASFEKVTDAQKFLYPEPQRKAA